MIKLIFVTIAIIGTLFIGAHILDKNSEHTDNEETYRIVKKIAEEAYANGQKDALNGKFVIEHIDSNMWRFNSSPWNDGTMFEQETLFLDK